MEADIGASIVSLQDAKGRIAGTGFVAGERLVLTCAHVVVQAGGAPGKTVMVRFHLNGEIRPVLVSPQAWQPPDGDDVAGLQLDSDLPAGVLPLALSQAEWSAGHSFRAFGYPVMVMGKYEGLWATGEIKGLVQEAGGRQMLQLASFELDQGMSGGPVWDETRRQVVGMVTAVYYPPGQASKHRDTAFATPTETLRRVCPEVAPRGFVPNPFHASGRINDPTQFFGRRRLIREIRAEIKKRCSVSLVGEAEMG
jgi:S1-C subfamily serine protease